MSQPSIARARTGGVALAAVIAMVTLIAACSAEPAFVRQRREEDLIETIRQALLESVAAEKSAVLATTDEESHALAREAQDLAAQIDRLRGELRPLVEGGGRAAELEQLDLFDAHWAELQSVDLRLLTLAVANTNLKAARLSAREGLAAIDRFVDALAEMQRSASDAETIRTLSGASVAALREQSLLLIHIPTADDAEMTRLEQRMGELAAEVDRDLAVAGAHPQQFAPQIADATSAWAEHRRIAAEVVKLSRENSNVRSFDVSVHEKRKVTKECLDALSALLDAVRAAPEPVR